MDDRQLDTLALHAGALDPRPEGAVVTPIFQSANFLQADADPDEGVTYARLSNTPNHRVLHARIAALEGAEAALVTASGMAAITTAVLSSCQTGDHALVQATVYGGTATFFQRDAPRFGIGHTRIDPTRPDTWAAALTPQTRLFYVESVSNPLLGLTDLPAVLAFAREHGLVAVVDNTFLSPINLRPIVRGFDLVVHSATKYLNGHSDVCAGTVAGDRARIEAAGQLLNRLGGFLDPHAAFLLERGLKTLGLRVRRQNETALSLAEVLQGRPGIAALHHPALGPNRDSPTRDWLAGFGGMLALELGDMGRTERFLDHLSIPVHAASLGGVESLVVQPAATTHRNVPPDQRLALGITDSLVRLSMGIEDPEDLIADVLQALEAAG